MTEPRVNLEELKAQVEEALRHRHDDFCRERSGWGGGTYLACDAARTEAAMPKTVLALIAEVEASRAERAEFFEKWPSGGWVDYESHRKVVAENEALRKALYHVQMSTTLDCPACRHVWSFTNKQLAPADATHEQEASDD